jgi:hypothetical protein
MDLRKSVAAVVILWATLATALLVAPNLRAALRTRLSQVARAWSPATVPLPAAPSVPVAPEASPSTTVRIDGDLRDWPSEGVRSEVAGADTGFPRKLPKTRYGYIVSLFADQYFLYIGWDFPNDTTDCRRGDGSNDLTSVKFGRNGDAESFMVNGLLHVCTLDPEWNYPDEGELDGYHSRWLMVDRSIPWDPVWGLRWTSGPFPRGVQAHTSFASGHRVTEWAVPLHLLGAAPCETVALNIFTLHDWKGIQYADASSGRPWIHDMTTLRTVVPCAESCQERWDCTEWTTPSPAGLESRSCIDLSGCENRRLLPPELRRSPLR